jgi:alpha-1,3/alpha-1,6-mannosyltransferase
MSTGTPVIATNVGGLPEVVQNGVTGYLVEPSPEEISKALLHLFQDEMSIREFGQNAKIIAKKNFSVQRFGQEITNEYTFALRETRE